MSDSLHIQVDYDHTEFTPGDTISGTVSWLPTPSTTGISLRLFWFTSGRGTQDIEVISELEWAVTPGSSTSRHETFSFILPNEPYSFSGQIVSLAWALEAVQEPEETSSRYPFTLTPNGEKITLTPVDNPITGKKKIAMWANARNQLYNN
ncbi:MAG: hypothetical protein KJO21_03830 [Verrucomicrobiae bacterium]|nr:hypothetical protein [Verrucomicrobiae bacterium]NNJ42629.1 hypothetical protein [Akkermansiaceae bacterium]